MINLNDPQTIPLFPDTPLYTMRVSLNGREFTLRFDYSQREDRWFLSLYDSAGSPIRKGIKITPNVSALRLARHDPRTPRGLLAFSDTTPRIEAPGFADLGRRISLVYFEYVSES